MFNYIKISIIDKWNFTTSPFLIIINDIDSHYTGRNTFCRLIDMLEMAGYKGNAYAFSQYSTDEQFGNPQCDLRKDKNIKYIFSNETKNNNTATLVIEVTK
jgi:predicted deacetylase